MRKLLTLKIFGKVQGIGFRYSTARSARKFGIVGFVRNEPEGAVYIEAEGDAEKLKEFLAWCERGPLLAQVKNIESKWSEEVKNFPGFEIQ